MGVEGIAGVSRPSSFFWPLGSLFSPAVAFSSSRSGRRMPSTQPKEDQDDSEEDELFSQDMPKLRRMLRREELGSCELR